MPESATDSRAHRPPNGWVLYDGECAFCTRWVGFWSGVLRRHGFATGELQAPWVTERLRMAPDELLHDIRVLTRAGAVVSGADVYLYVWRRIWWAWPLYAIFSLPGFNRLIHAGYRWFARNRYCVSGACRLRR